MLICNCVLGGTAACLNCSERKKYELGRVDLTDTFGPKLPYLGERPKDTFGPGGEKSDFGNGNAIVAKVNLTPPETERQALKRRLMMLPVQELKELIAEFEWLKQVK